MKYVSVKLSDGLDIPGGYPVECREQNNRELEPGFDAVMTPEELESLKQGMRSVYETWLESQIIQTQPPELLRTRDFVNRIPPEKAIAIVAAAQSNPQLGYLLLLLQSGETIDRDDERLLGALDSLVEAGLLSREDVNIALA